MLSEVASSVPARPLPRLFRRPGAAGQRARAGAGVVRQGPGHQPAAAQRLLRRLPGAAAPGPGRRGGAEAGAVPGARARSARRVGRVQVHADGPAGHGAHARRAAGSQPAPPVCRSATAFTPPRPRPVAVEADGPGGPAAPAPSPCADLDGDGELDLFLANAVTGDSPNAVLMNERGRRATFDRSHPAGAGRGVRTALWGDIDDDGLLDVVLLRQPARRRSGGSRRPARWRDVTTAMRAATPGHRRRRRRALRRRPRRRSRPVAGQRPRSPTSCSTTTATARSGASPPRPAWPRIAVRRAASPWPTSTATATTTWSSSRRRRRTRCSSTTASGSYRASAGVRRAFAAAAARRRRRRRQRRRRPGRALHVGPSWPRALAAGRRGHVERHGDRDPPIGRSAGPLADRRRRRRRGARSARRAATAAGPRGPRTAGERAGADVDQASSGVTAWAVVHRDPARGPSVVRPGVVRLARMGARTAASAVSGPRAHRARGRQRSAAVEHLGDRHATGGARRIALDGRRHRANRVGPGPEPAAGHRSGSAAPTRADFVSLVWSDGILQTEIDLDGRPRCTASRRRSASSRAVRCSSPSTARLPLRHRHPRRRRHRLPRTARRLQPAAPARAGPAARGGDRRARRALRAGAGRTDGGGHLPRSRGADRLRPAARLADGARRTQGDRRARRRAARRSSSVRSGCPARVTNDRGQDVTRETAAADLVAAPPGAVDPRFIGRTAPHARHARVRHADRPGPGAPVLMIDGWVEYPYAQTVFAAWQAGAPYLAPTLEARDGDGRWHVVAREFGYPAGMPRRMTLPLPPLPAGTTRAAPDHDAGDLLGPPGGDLRRAGARGGAPGRRR